MDAGYLGTFVISWAQTEVDGIAAAPLHALTVGAQWCWWGEAVRIDGPADILLLQGAEGEADVRRRAERAVRRLMGAAVSGREFSSVVVDQPQESQGFTVTDGYQAYRISVVDLPDAAARLLMFVGRVPPKGTELWVVERALLPQRAMASQDTPAVICFTPGTMIETPQGPRPVQELRAGAHVCTRDDGPQEILWVGSRRMSGARLYAMPQLRPIRFRAGALGIGRPEGDLLVSPQHRVLVSGAAARALFNESEVLVAAADLVNGRTIRIEQGLREVNYVHLLLGRHQVLQANGLATESFHPASSTLEMILPEQRQTLLELFPRLEQDLSSYGDFARRSLLRAEAAILRHELAA